MSLAILGPKQTKTEANLQQNDMLSMLLEPLQAVFTLTLDTDDRVRNTVT